MYASSTGSTRLKTRRILGSTTSRRLLTFSSWEKHMKSVSCISQSISSQVKLSVECWSARHAGFPISRTFSSARIWISSDIRSKFSDSPLANCQSNAISSLKVLRPIQAFVMCGFSSKSCFSCWFSWLEGIIANWKPTSWQPLTAPW